MLNEQNIFCLIRRSNETRTLMTSNPYESQPLKPPDGKVVESDRPSWPVVVGWNAFVWIVLLIPFVVFLLILAFGDVYVFDTFIEVSSVRDRIRPITALLVGGHLVVFPFANLILFRKSIKHTGGRSVGIIVLCALLLTFMAWLVNMLIISVIANTFFPQ
jgi:hypothetical protein